MGRVLNLLTVFLFIIIGGLVFLNAMSILPNIKTVFHEIQFYIMMIGVYLSIVAILIVAILDNIMRQSDNLEDKLATKKDIDKLYEALRNVEKSTIPPKTNEPIQKEIKNEEAKEKHPAKSVPCPKCQRMLSLNAIEKGLRECPSCKSAFAIE
jgi:biopolymer transport protein ExbB/TolQ